MIKARKTAADLRLLEKLLTETFFLYKKSISKEMLFVKSKNLFFT